ncbi:hypothetical protein ACJJTC_016919 [Scirpophaga incertulas]
MEEMRALLLEIPENKKHKNLLCKDMEIQDIYRIGEKNENPGPVVVTLTTFSKKLTILRESRTNKTTLYIKEEYPPNILSKRKELQKIAKSEREKGRKVAIRYDKLVYLDRKKDETSFPTPVNNPSLSRSVQDSGNTIKRLPTRLVTEEEYDNNPP